MSVLLAVWQRIHEPRVNRALWSVVYALILAGGAAVIWQPPNSLVGTIGWHLSYTWGALLVIAGILGIPGVLYGRWWIERMALNAALAGTAIYAVVIMQLHLTHTSGNRLPQFFAVTALAVLFLIKRYEIRGLNYEPRA